MRTRRAILAGFWLAFISVNPADAAPANGIVVLPESIQLSGPEATQQLRVYRVAGGEIQAHLPGATLTSESPDIVSIDENGELRAASDGKARVRARINGTEAVAEVEVTRFNDPHQWSFRHHVLPVVSSLGCNTGGCHGAVAGKGGFRLSLMGYDPVGDYYTMTREARGRRVELAAPARSLLLTKPTAAAAHKGGKRLDPRSLDYRILSEWIVGGAAPPAEEDAVVERLEVLPDLSVLKPGDRQPLLVRVFYSNGRSEDVTRWARFSSADETVATVDKDTGEVSVIGHGEGAITAWFSSRIAIARVTSPFPNKIPKAVFAKAPRRNLIDDHVLEQLERLKLKPSPRTNDGEFLRRVYLDTIGVLPTVEETREFLSDKAPDKRDRVIDRLLEREEFVDYWTYRWSDVFLVNGRLLRPDAVKAYYEWLRQRVAENTPWDELAEQIVTAKGGSLENGATNFYAVHQDPETMAENVSQAFLGLSINCAKCHNHPLEKWSNDQYYAFANLFARVRAKGWGGDARNGDGVRTLFVEPRGDLMQPRTGKPQPPAPLDGEALPMEATGDRREALAEWLTSPENPYFTKAVVNRVWAAYFGIGLVDPVDDLRVSNPASNGPLFDALADYLVEEDYDLKALMRLILQSETWQRSSRVLPENRDEQRYFSRYYPRRLMAEMLYDAFAGVTGVSSEFVEIAQRDGSSQKTEFYPKGTRALELFDSSVANYFLRTFGRNERMISCDCERSNQPSMIQVLHLSNGDTLNDRLRAEEGRVSELMDSFGDDAAGLIDEAYLQCLSRSPTDEEREKFTAMISEAPEKERRAVVEDLFWALMSSREFLFQH